MNIVKRSNISTIDAVNLESVENIKKYIEDMYTLNNDKLYTIIDNGESRYSFSKEDLIREEDRIFNKLSNGDLSIYQKVFGSLYLNINRNTFRNLFSLKYVSFARIRKVMECDFSTDCLDETSHDTGIKEFKGVKLIKELCNYLYESNVIDEFNKTMNISMNEIYGQVHLVVYSDVYIELKSGKKLKMSMEDFRTIFGNVVIGADI